VNLGEDFARGAMRLLIWPLLKIVIKFFMFTGLYWGVIYFVFLKNSTGSAISTILMLLTLTQNIARLSPSNRTFTWLGLLSRGNRAKEKKITSPKASTELKTTTPEGFLFGRQGFSFIRKAITMDGHILVIGGAGSGKSSCLAIPSLWSWESMVFAIDIKGELYAKTKHIRPNIKIFNPMDSNSEGYNPYYLLGDSYNPVQDAREITLAIVPKPADVKEPFWVESAQNLFTGAILHCHAYGLTFLETIELIQSTPIQELINDIHRSLSQEARYFVNQFIGMDMKTLASIYSELANKIMPFATDPNIKACLTQSRYITPMDIEDGYDIYLTIPEDKIEQWKGLLTLITNQFLKHFERRTDMAATPVLFLLDEFARLGKVETVINGLATLRSKKITICVITQSLAQLDVIYGKEQRQVIADNCQYKAILNATDADTQDYFSRQVGTYDKAKYSTNANFEQYTGMGKGTGTSEMDTLTENHTKLAPTAHSKVVHQIQAK